MQDAAGPSGSSAMYAGESSGGEDGAKGLKEWWGRFKAGKGASSSAAPTPSLPSVKGKEVSTEAKRACLCASCSESAADNGMPSAGPDLDRFRYAPTLPTPGPLQTASPSLPCRSARPSPTPRSRFRRRVRPATSLSGASSRPSSLAGASACPACRARALPRRACPFQAAADH
jgi:hypothetical protein